MIFSELYSAYYNAVAAILKEAAENKIDSSRIRDIIEKYAFGESVLNIEPALKEGRWSLLKPNGTSVLEKTPTMPLTKVEKQWLKAISMDPRVSLFLQKEIPDDKKLTTDSFVEQEISNTDKKTNIDNSSKLKVQKINGFWKDNRNDLPPLFTPSDYELFDRYLDGDDYTDENYRSNFRLILDAIKNHYPLSIYMENRTGKRMRQSVLPDHLEYSEKDDKFRLIGAWKKSRVIINLGRILNCRRYTGPKEPLKVTEENGLKKAISKKVVFELDDRRNALERVLLHFAHFEKQAEHIEDRKYKVTVIYDKDDETEMVIRLLSFGPMVKVVSPESFVDLIKKRLLDQKSCGL